MHLLIDQVRIEPAKLLRQWISHSNVFVHQNEMTISCWSSDTSKEYFCNTIFYWESTLWVSVELLYLKIGFGGPAPPRVPNLARRGVRPWPELRVASAASPPQQEAELGNESQWRIGQLNPCKNTIPLINHQRIYQSFSLNYVLLPCKHMALFENRHLLEDRPFIFLYCFVREGGAQCGKNPIHNHFPYFNGSKLFTTTMWTYFHFPTSPFSWRSHHSSFSFIP